MRKLLIFLILFLIPIVSAIPECQRENNVANIPCNIISSWKPSGNCGDYSITIYNSSGEILQENTWGDYIPVCNSTFNITQIGTYHYNSTIEEGVITIAGDSLMIAAIIIIIPLIMAIVFILASFSMSDTHSVLRWYFMLMSMIMFFVAFYFGTINVVKFMDFPELQEAIGSATFWFSVLFGGICLYLLIYMIYTFVKSAAKAKQERIEY